MKKSVFTALLALAMIGTSAEAQVKVHTGDGGAVSVMDNDNEDVFMNLATENKDDFALEIAGFKIRFQPNEAKGQECEEERYDDFRDEDEEIWSETKGKRNKVQISYDDDIWDYGYEMGLSILHDTDYSLYPTSAGEFMSLDQRKSIHMAIPLLTTGSSVIWRDHIGLSSSLLLTCDNYSFSNRITLAPDAAGMLQPESVSVGNYKKSKLTTAALRIPVLLHLRFGKVSLAGGAYGEVLINSHTKVKFPREKERLSQLNQLRYGFYARAGIDDTVYVYGEIGRTALFKSDKGPETFPYSIGIGFNL